MVVFRDGLPFQSIAEVEVIHQRDAAVAILDGVVQRDAAQLARTNVAIGYIGVDRQIGGCAELERAIFLHTSIGNVDKWCRLCCEIINRMTVSIAIHSRELASPGSISLRERTFVYLRSVLLLRTSDFERSRVEILIYASAVEPSAAQRAIHIERKLL